MPRNVETERLPKAKKLEIVGWASKHGLKRAEERFGVSSSTIARWRRVLDLRDPNGSAELTVSVVSQCRDVPLARVSCEECGWVGHIPPIEVQYYRFCPSCQRRFERI